ncbi:tRNA (adenosine(37)-N6)-dimethylallyltransferase MiaA [Lactobacillus sp. ESL0263]|uniref:tRNA (adenosine(37)-N6)-dimethylallyltransferase MiaA n=1 Tax=Lactobacillus sp. ESL0263 TaxID=2069350 RepID=UPI000EFCD420|nr:tRNA (adenosine(37)-N6)-dimethylallyltransferase MiaA [Lactobacillus sp. ESL0263]RMC50476.1 tRNA (adenosine(37)-N6)-dimethylallyltransferase MiaA [Lactobacillus sp. ESL0263]
MQKILAIVGPTAIGKTSTAINLATELNAEIISGDSMQIYREVKVGTAKPTSEEQALIKHYLVDVQSVYEPYSVKDFVDQAQQAVSEIAHKNKLPILVGGTGFYVNALLNRMQLGEVNEHKQAVDDYWQSYLDKNGEAALWQELAKQDQVTASRIPVTNSRRVLRALTVIKRTGKKFSEQQTQIKPRYDYLIFGLNSDRQEIYHRIDLRVDQMMDAGLLDEARFIYDNRQKEYQVLQAIGYKEFFPYFEGNKELDDCVKDLKTASRRYAKRQLTYFRHQLPITWVDPLNDQDYLVKMKQKAEEWLNE